LQTPWHLDKSTFWSAFNWPIDVHKQPQTLWQMTTLDCIKFIDVGNSCKLQHLNKWRFWSAFNCPIDVGKPCKLEHPNKLMFWSAVNWPIDVSSSCKLKHPHKSRFWNAPNCQKMQVILTSLNDHSNEGFRVHSIGQ